MFERSIGTVDFTVSVVEVQTLLETILLLLLLLLIVIS